MPTPRFNLDTYQQGDTDWSHTDTVEFVDEYSIDRGLIADRPSSGEYDDEMYYAIDQGVLYRWDIDANDWITETHDNTSHSADYTTLTEVNNNADVPNADFADEAGNADTVDGENASAFADTNHGNEEHSSDFTTLTEVNNNADVPEADNADTVGGELPSAFADTNHDNTEHSLTFVSDGDGIERQIWIIANGASDPAGAGTEDIIFEEQA